MPMSLHDFVICFNVCDIVYLLQQKNELLYKNTILQCIIIAKSYCGYGVFKNLILLELITLSILLYYSAIYLKLLSASWQNKICSC